MVDEIKNMVRISGKMRQEKMANNNEFRSVPVIPDERYVLDAMDKLDFNPTVILAGKGRGAGRAIRILTNRRLFNKVEITETRINVEEKEKKDKDQKVILNREQKPVMVRFETIEIEIKKKN